MFVLQVTVFVSKLSLLELDASTLPVTWLFGDTVAGWIA